MNHEPFLSSSHTSWSSSLKLPKSKPHNVEIVLSISILYLKEIFMPLNIWRSTLNCIAQSRSSTFGERNLPQPMCIINEMYKLSKGLLLQSRNWYMSKSNREFVTFIYNQTVLLSFKSYYFMKISDTQNLQSFQLWVMLR